MKTPYCLGWLALLLLLAPVGRAQLRPTPVFFSEDEAARAAAEVSPLRALLTAARPLSLDAMTLRAALADPAAVLLLPLPNGQNARFSVREAPVMAPALAARFPAIRTYAGLGLDDPTATLRLDDAPQGFHAQILSATMGAVYLDPVSTTDAGHYLSYFVTDQRPGQARAGCLTPAGLDNAVPPANGQQRALPTDPTLLQRAYGDSLHTFRLAVATTDEYTAARGGTVASALASVVTTVNRVTGFYERELAIRLELVANNNLVIAANSASQPDPFSNNNNTATALRENQLYLDTIIGRGSYDIGHVFGTISGGYAGIGIVCSTYSQANAQTGLGNPVGDAFAIQLVAHEMGHQFGATHTFNAAAAGNCNPTNREATTACEPGSGSTMMAYPGICGPENLQGGRDGYFHSVSHGQIINQIVNRSRCAVNRASGNTAPRSNGPGSGKTLPANTPFRLTANAFDAENDALTYCWEQVDNGTGGPLGAPQVAGAREPLFCSVAPGGSPTRYFPQLANLLNNNPSLADRLPTVTRNLTFQCLVRDVHSGPAGVVGGSSATNRLTLRVTDAAGPFLVTAPNTTVSWPVGSTQTVAWNVAGTTANGVNCAEVDVWLSADGGLTYPTLLLARAPNTGSALVTVPNVPTATARLMVAAADNYFFDVSNQNFTITPTPGAPLLTGLSAGSLPVGAQLTISGSNLAGATAVTFGGVAAAFSSVSATSLVATVPATATGGPVMVRTNAGLSNGLAFAVVPTIISFSPGSGLATGYGLAGDTVTINTMGAQNLVNLEFNGVPAVYSVTNTTGTQVRVVVPFGATTGPISLLTTKGRITSTAVFTVLPTPCFAATNLTVGSITRTSARVTFTASLGIVDEYRLATVPATLAYPDFASGGLITGLAPATLYTVTVESNCPVTGETRTVSTHFYTPPTGSNDECATATLLVAGAPGEVCIPAGGNMAGATQSLPPAWCSGTIGTVARDVWFRFVATGPVHTVSVASGFNGVLEVLSGTCGALSSLECADAVANNRSETITLLTLVPGTTYWVRYYPKPTTINIDTGNSYVTACVTTPTPALAACPAVGSPAISSITTNGALLTFAAGSGPTNFVVSTSPPTRTYSTTMTSVALTGLQPSIRYVVSVVRQCAGGQASAPALVDFVTTSPDLVVTGYNIPPVRSSTYRNITVTSTGSAALSGPVHVLGTMRMQKGGALADDCQVLSGPGSFVLEPGATLNICNPQGISQTGATGAIQVTGSRTFGNNADYVYLIDRDGITGSGLPDTVRTLQAYNTGSAFHNLTLSRSTAVRTSVNLSNETNLLLANANLLLLSDIRRTACVENYAGRVLNTGSGRATMQRYVSPTTAYAGPGYRHYSPPVRGATVGSFAVAGRFAPLVGSAYNALPTPALAASQFPNVFRYTESRLTAAFPGFDVGWESPVGLADSLAAGRGYTVNVAPAATVVLTGQLNSGNLNTGPLGCGPGPNGGWHLLGNPYPSSLYFGQAMTDTLPAGLARAIYIFEPSSRYGGFYRSFVNGISSDGSPCYLPAMQAFFIRALRPVPAGLTFYNDFRDAYTNDSAAFHRAGRWPGGRRGPMAAQHPAAPARPTLRLALAGAAPADGPPDYAVIYLAARATASGADTDHDAVKLPGPGAAFSIASRMAGPGNDDLAINALPPLASPTASHRVPLVLHFTAPGTYVFRASQQHFTPTQGLFLLDHATGRTVDLRQQPNYGFSVAQAGAVAGRFEVVLGPVALPTTTKTATNQWLDFWPNPVRGGENLHLALDAPTTATAVLQTLVGQIVLRQTFEGRSADISTQNLAPGVYLLTVQAAGRAASTRRVVVE